MMAGSIVLIILSLVCKTTVGTDTIHGEIVTHPHSLNVSLGSLARFTCEGRGFTLQWFINGLVENHYDNTDRGPIEVSTSPNSTTGLIMSLIDIPAKFTNNNISIVCTAFGGAGGTNNDSEPAVLRIQGLLPPVVNLVGIFKNFSMLVSWEPPATLEGVPIIGYNVTVYDAETTQIVVYSDTMLTATSFQVSGVELQACHNYTTTVMAINSIGQGNSTSFTLGAAASEGGYPGVPQIGNVQVLTKASRVNDNNRLVNIRAQATGDCKQQYPTGVTVYLRSTDSALVAVNLTTISSNNVVLGGLTDTVPSDKHYTLDISLTNTAGMVSSSLKTTISTFDTQSLMFGRSTTSLACFRCSFLEDSTAEGCSVQLPSGLNVRSTRLSSDDLLSQWTCSAERLQQTALSLTVFDIESNGTVSTEPALSLESVTATIVAVVDIPVSSSSGGVALPTSRAVAPGSSVVPLVVAVVAVVFIITLLVVGVVVMAAVLIRRKAHIQDVNHRSSKDNCKCQDVIFTELNPVYECSVINTEPNPVYECSVISTEPNPVYVCSQEVVISTAANPLYGGLGAPPIVTNGPVYDTVGNTTDEDSLCKPHIVCDTNSKPPSAAAAEVVYDTVGGKLSLMDPPPGPITPYATIPNNYITTKR